MLVGVFLKFGIYEVRFLGRVVLNGGSKRGGWGVREVGGGGSVRK